MKHFIPRLVALFCGLVSASVPAEAFHTPNGPDVESRLQISNVIVVKGQSLVARPAAKRALVNEWINIQVRPPAPFSLTKEFIRRAGSSAPFAPISEWIGARTGQSAPQVAVNHWIGLQIRPSVTVYVSDNSKMRPPVDNPLVTSRFGHRIHPVTYRNSFHDGVDFDAEYKDDVVSVFDGVVTRAGRRGALGISVEVLHPGKGIKSIVGHLATTTVKPGQVVKQGQVIGLAGSTGRSSGTHVHLTVRNVETEQLLDALSFMGPQREIAPWRHKAHMVAKARHARSHRVASARKRNRTTIARSRGKSYRIAAVRHQNRKLIARTHGKSVKIASRKHAPRVVARSVSTSRRIITAHAR